MSKVDIAASEFVTKTDLTALSKREGYIGVAYKAFRAGWAACSRHEGAEKADPSNPQIEDAVAAMGERAAAIFLAHCDHLSLSYVGPEDTIQKIKEIIIDRDKYPHTLISGGREYRYREVPVSAPAYDVQQAAGEFWSDYSWKDGRHRVDICRDAVHDAFQAGAKWAKDRQEAQTGNLEILGVLATLNTIVVKLEEMTHQIAGEGQFRERDHAELLGLVEAIHGAGGKQQAALDRIAESLDRQDAVLTWKLTAENGSAAVAKPEPDIQPLEQINDETLAMIAEQMPADRYVAERQRRDENSEVSKLKRDVSYWQSVRNSEYDRYVKRINELKNRLAILEEIGRGR